MQSLTRVKDATEDLFSAWLYSSEARYVELNDGTQARRRSRAGPVRSPFKNARFRWLALIIAIILVLGPGPMLLKGLFDLRDRYGDIHDARDQSKALVIASFTKQDVSWLDQVPSDWIPHRYVLDDPDPPTGLRVPRNQGREAMAYLTYIIDNYDNLPAYIIFTHGHYRSWHQVEPLPAKIRALNLTALAREQYISFRCGDQMGCERLPFLDTKHVNWEGEDGLVNYWNHILPNEEIPRNISYKCCAQHAVTRKAVRRRSQEQWMKIREPLLGDLSPFSDISYFTPEWIVGTYYEKLWHILFGMGSTFCPSVEYCNMVHFSNAITCDQGIDFHMDDGDQWSDTVCVSAFDNVPPDESANLTNFNIVEAAAFLRRARRDRINRERESHRKIKQKVKEQADLIAEQKLDMKEKDPAASQEAPAEGDNGHSGPPQAQFGRSGHDQV